MAKGSSLALVAINAKYLELWGQSATLEACTGSGDPPLFCDQDGALTTFATYGGTFADAALAFVLGCDALLKAGRFSSLWDPTAVHDAVVALGEFEGVSGRVRFDTATGDGLGSFDFKNFQIR